MTVLCMHVGSWNYGHKWTRRVRKTVQAFSHDVKRSMFVLLAHYVFHAFHERPEFNKRGVSFTVPVFPNWTDVLIEREAVACSI